LFMIPTDIDLFPSASPLTQVMRALEHFKSMYDRPDVLNIIYYSGHGGGSESNDFVFN